MPEKRKVLIIGSSGMLGVDLCNELRSNYDILGADLVQRPLRGGCASLRTTASPSGRLRFAPHYSIQRFLKCDITDKQSTLNVIKKANPDIVIHAAAWTDVDGCELDPKKAYKINSFGAKNVALACKAAGSSLIYISTDFVFNGKRRMPYKETDSTNPVSIYGDSKLIGEEAIKKTLKKYFILRTSWLYGKHGKNFVDTILKLAKKEKCLRVVNDQVGSPTYTKDLAKAIHKLIDGISCQPSAISHQLYGIYHMSNSGRVSWCDYAKEILRLMKFRTKVVPISSQELASPAKRPAMSVLDNSKFVKFTGYRMRNWRKALRDYVR